MIFEINCHLVWDMGKHMETVCMVQVWCWRCETSITFTVWIHHTSCWAKNNKNMLKTCQLETSLSWAQGSFNLSHCCKVSDHHVFVLRDHDHHLATGSLKLHKRPIKIKTLRQKREGGLKLLKTCSKHTS